MSSVFYYCTGLKNITMSDNVISIGILSFFNCSTLQDMELSKNIITIGYGAFASCVEWKNDIILEKIVSIGKVAFGNCRNVKEIVLGASLKEIGEMAFGDMHELKVVYNLNPTPIVLELMIYDISFNIPFYFIPPPVMYVPVGSGNAYRNAVAWDVFVIEEKEYTNNEAVNSEVVTITPANGGITINSVEPIQAYIYSINGQVLFKKFFAGRLDIQLQRGIYVVKTNYLTKKIIVQ